MPSLLGSQGYATILGAINLLIGLYDAKADHVPVVAIVGQQARSALGSNYQQEVDLQTLVSDVTEYVMTATMPAQVRTLIDRAVRIAQAKRAVTSVIIPNDLQDVDYAEDDTNNLGGAARMGDNLVSSVVNADFRSWDIPNLWVCDGSVLPTVGGVNPALTIQTIAMRTASRSAFSRGEANYEPRAPATGRRTAVQIVTEVILIAFVRVGVVANGAIWLVWRQTATTRRSWPGRR